MEKDLGLPNDLNVVRDGVRARWKGSSPRTILPLPLSLDESDISRLAAVILSHHHWDHCGDLSTVPRGVPIYAGPGTAAAVQTMSDGLGVFIGDTRPEVVTRIHDIVGSRIRVEPFADQGVDFFGDGSFVVIPAPGVRTVGTAPWLMTQHCQGHALALIRTTIEPETCA